MKNGKRCESNPFRCLWARKLVDWFAQSCRQLFACHWTLRIINRNYKWKPQINCPNSNWLKMIFFQTPRILSPWKALIRRFRLRVCIWWKSTMQMIVTAIIDRASRSCLNYDLEVHLNHKWNFPRMLSSECETYKNYSHVFSDWIIGLNAKWETNTY